MPDNGSDALSFRISTENLHRAIEILRPLGGLAVYPKAYQVLLLERHRRRAGSPPNQIPLARAAFEALPTDVQQLLMAEPG